MIAVIQWLFHEPSTIIALISVSIAILVYFYQRKQHSKYNSYQIADQYATSLMKRIRYVKAVLNDINFSDFVSDFEDKMIRFDNGELNLLLERNKYNTVTIQSELNRINKEGLRKHMIEPDFFEAYNTLEQYASGHTYARFFEKYILDLLNELESVCILLRYNLADEKIIYQSLHQSFLKNFPYWYYFIAKDNYMNENRYYDNLIWVYKKWKSRHNKLKEKNAKQQNSYIGNRL